MTNNNTNRRATEKAVKYVYWIVFLLLLLSYFITLFANRQLVRQANWVEHNNNVINHVSDILAKVKDAETGARGYIITKKN